MEEVTLPTHTSYPFSQSWNFPVLLWVGVFRQALCSRTALDTRHSFI